MPGSPVQELNIIGYFMEKIKKKREYFEASLRLGNVRHHYYFRTRFGRTS